MPSGAGLRELLDPQVAEIAALWQRLYDSTTASGRWDSACRRSPASTSRWTTAGKQIGQPTYKLMGGARRERIYTPYATIFPGWPRASTIAKLMDRMAQLFERALGMGFQAVKMCVIFGSIGNLIASWRS